MLYKRILSPDQLSPNIQISAALCIQLPRRNGESKLTGISLIHWQYSLCKKIKKRNLITRLKFYYLYHYTFKCNLVGCIYCPSVKQSTSASLRSTVWSRRCTVILYNYWLTLTKHKSCYLYTVHHISDTWPYSWFL